MFSFHANTAQYVGMRFKNIFVDLEIILILRWKACHSEKCIDFDRRSHVNIQKAVLLLYSDRRNSRIVRCN